ncbi:MAG: YdeI/OmpD-associated family protein [Bacteroidota bacterium]
MSEESVLITKGSQQIRQLEKRKGGYFYLEIPADVVNALDHKKSTRVICHLNGEVSYRCGFNHLGDGNYYLIVATKILKQLAITPDESADYEIYLDPDQLGVEVPEVLTVFLEQDEEAKNTYDSLTNGKKRSLIYSIAKMKDIDKQVSTIISFLDSVRLKTR